MSSSRIVGVDKSSSVLVGKNEDESFVDCIVVD